MKKRKIALCLVLASALAFTPVLGACSTDSLSAVDFPRDQKTSYAVTSQGGSTVAYGNYIYFVNGTRGYADTKGESNVWGKVVKGGLYRAKLNGKAVKEDGDAYTRFEPTLDIDAGLEFKYTKSTDYFDKPVNVVDVTKIAPKTIGTDGYGQGGIFIYDSHIYFASPNNEQDSVGNIQTGRTDFYMMSLKTGKPVKVYTTSEDVDTVDAEYAFYKYGGAVYLVVNEGGTIVSVKINPTNEKAENPVMFKVKATSVYFPVRDTYYKGIDNTTVEDFIYFVRPAKSNEEAAGIATVIEAMRPNGKENFIISTGANAETIEAVRDGVFFWRSQNEYGEKVIKYDNLQEQRYAHSASYKKAQDKLAANDATKDMVDRSIRGQFETAITSSMTSTYAFRPNDDAQSNGVYFVAVTSSVMYKYDANNNAEVLYTGTTGTPMFDYNGYLYYSAGSEFYRVPLYSNHEKFGEIQMVAEDTITSSLGGDYAAGYFTYFGVVDQWASGYTFFNKVDGYEGLEPQFVGKLAKSDIPTDEQIENAK